MLGLSDEEYRRLSPRQFAALSSRAENVRKRSELNEEFMLAQLTAAVINFSMCRPKKPLAVTDLMPSRQTEKAKPKRRRRGQKDIRAEAERLFAHFERR